MCYLIKAPLGKSVRILCDKSNLSYTLQEVFSTIYNILYFFTIPASYLVYIVRIPYLVRIVFHRAVITLIADAVQVCIPLVYVVDILTVVHFIKDSCKIKESS